MTDSGPVRPRRALAPLPDDAVDDDFDSETPPSQGRRGLPALPDEPESDPPEVETQVLRRVLLSDSAPSPASPATPPTSGRVWTPTPVPPPRPVLPASTTLPTSAGRRFSASDSPREYAYAPRRSATSVTSPPEDFSSPSPSASSPSTEEPDQTRLSARASTGYSPRSAVPASPSDEIDRTRLSARASSVYFGTPRQTPSNAPAPEPASPPVEPPPTSQPAPTRRSGRRALIVLAGVVVVAGLVASTVNWLAPQAPAVLAPPLPAPSPSLDALLGPDDLGQLGTTTSWVTAAAAPGGGDGNPVCLPSSVETMPTADRTNRRVLTSESTDVDYVSHVVDSYPDRATANQAYQQRLLQAGSCADTNALIVSADSISGLADNAFVTQIQIQGSSVEYHTVLVSQTGRNLSMIDISAADPVRPADAVGVAAKPLARLCSGGQGACPSTPELTEGVPAAGRNPGWLIEADLPRITAGAGRWAASPPDSKLTIVGSQCEAVPLKKVEGVTASAQRTLLLADDPAAPTVFGVDQVVYTFPDAKSAKAFADTVTENIDDCPATVPTAAVEKGPSAKGEGAGAIAFSGKSFLVTQQTGTNNSVTYRVGVVRIGARVSYLLANPSADFNFTDAQWKTILQRTGERVSQMP